jgi:hypothetical protein
MRYLHRFTILAWEANAMPDAGESLDIDETREHIQDGQLIDWFARRFSKKTDLSPYETEDRSDIVALCLQAIQGGEETYAGNG